MSSEMTSAMTPPKSRQSGSADLAALLSRRLGESLLPGEVGFSAAELTTAAGFLLATAATRAPQQSLIAIETITDAFRGRFMRIAVINEDMPFLVDSIAATVTAQGLVIDRLLHPVLAVRRDAAGALTALPEGEAPGTPRESMIYIETRRAEARTRSALQAALEETLADVRLAVAEWKPMQAAMAEDADRLDALGRPEGAALLRWFGEGMLTQLGHVRRHRDGSQEGALGVCKASAAELLSDASYARAFAWFDGKDADERLPLAIKSHRISHVHRRVPLDLFIVPIYEGNGIDAGKLTALSVHAGVWTSAALAAAPGQVPRLRAQLAALMAKYGFDRAGHAGKALAHALTKLPHDLLIGFADPDVEHVAMALMSLIDRPRPKLALVAAPLARHILAFAWLPRDAMSTDNRRNIVAMLEEVLGAHLLDWSLEVEGSNLAQLLFVLDIRDRAGSRDLRADEAALDARLQAMVRGWGDAVEAELARSEEPSRAAAVAARYAEAFPLAYRTAEGPAEAALDIARLRRLPLPGEGIAARGVRLRDAGDDRLRLKLYQRSGALVLSDVVPALENFGFQVIETVPTELTGRGGESLGSIHDFLLAGGSAVSLSDLAMLEEALAAVLNGGAEDDAFNRLIAGVGLLAREADWLRASYRYLRQAGLSFSLATVVDALLAAPMVTRGLLDLFRARHDPAYQSDRAAGEAAAEAAILEGLAGVSAINDDRLLRQYRALVLAMLRTNAFAPGGAEALAFKLDSAEVPGLPKPLPWREISVYSRRVEGIHLRAGPVARGGLRWSDRRDDFRTEVLGLMKAQRVKNAVIVPTGAKGGFYPKQLPDPARDRDAWAAEGRASYQVFIRALLSITDNIVGGAVVHPDSVVIRDGEDPYFVVAADKGTATFSDTANALAQAEDFWLDDAFASGGSKGYDHKAMGITAKGAWLSVQRHFREMGIDVQSEPVRVIGVGDMSGDVFGNGMLLSQAIKLVAAFDHRHIFLDPDPDPAAAWAERNRMFQLPRSSWADYDAALISRGGGVFPRSQKAIPLSEEVRAVLGLTMETIEPEALIRAILTAPVDLLWFGGIGTYVKAAAENNIEVGDPANDSIRIDARQLRAHVVGEGANLGATQAGRIEFALKGGRINTDFIDNSAGVDCSDKEVNIKIALAAAKRSGAMDEKARVALLTAMTDDVAALVLEDNRLQALALSVAQAGGAAAIASELRLIEMFEDGGQLDRRTEGLADNDTLTRRAAEGNGLVRPELAVLLSTAKLLLQDALERSTVPDDPGHQDDLLAAFPPAMRERCREEIFTHRLRREILATRFANRLVNRLGMVHPFELAEEEGAGLGDVTAAFLAAERLFGMDAIWARIEAAAMPEPARIRLIAATAAALRTHMADLLRAGIARAPATQFAEELAPAIAELNARTDELLEREGAGQSRRMREAFLAAGVPVAEAAAVTRLFDLDGVVGLARLARDSRASAVALTHGFTRLGSALGLDWAQSTAVRMTPSDPWERLLVAGLARDFQQMRLDFLRRLGGGRRDGDPHEDQVDPVAAVEGWLEKQRAAVRRFRGMVARAELAASVTPAMLAQIASQARNLLAH
jgi:glutamate dehydrogenase